MKTSARNQFAGTVSKLVPGAVNDEVEITVSSGQKIVAVVTHESAGSLGLAVGAKAFALIKASSIIIATDLGNVRLSTRNQLSGFTRWMRVSADERTSRCVLKYITKQLSFERSKMTKLLQRRAFSLIGGLLISGLSVAVSAQELTVSAAASLQNAMRDIGAAYQAANPGVKINFNFAASGPLLTQIAQGAPVDVFASADLETMDKAQAQNLINPATRVNFAANDLVLVSPATKPVLSSINDLSKPTVERIAVGSPSTVPAGRYTQVALEKRGLWGGLTPKFVFAENVRQSLNYVSRAEVDAGFVYRTDAMIEKDKVRVDLVVELDKPVLYPIALVATSKNAQAAGAFMKFVTSAPGQAVLAKYGFSKP
jgi:molybdate transport system substrate-binding protein